MKPPSQKAIAALEVHIRFENGRFSAECLAKAYEQIIPIVCRTTGDVNPTTQAQSVPIFPETGGLSR
jgi:hypothetical protein